MRTRTVQSLSHLPTYIYGHHMTTWWGTLAFITLEGTGFVLATGAYLYLVAVNPSWPIGARPPDLLWSSLLTVLLVLSAVPNHFAYQFSKREHLLAVRVLTVVMSLVGLGAIVLRGFEFTTLNVRWYDNAYGSLVWAILGLHTAHLVTDVADTIVLTVIMFTRHGRGKRFSDVEDNAFYWYFVVAAWLPLYTLLYWLPRLTENA